MPYAPRAAGAALRVLILAQAATPEGYRARDARHLSSQAQSAKTCERLVRAGKLHVAKVPTHYQRYFSTAEAAAHFLATTPPKSRAEKQAEDRARYAARVGNSGQQVRVAKPAAPPKPPKLTYAEASFLRSAAGKAYTPPAPRPDAEIVHTAHTRYSSSLMPPPRNQVITHGFLHNGYGVMR
jgi:hypothetical protein